MITFELSGDLAHQLFQICTTICYARQNNETFFFLLKNFLKDGHVTYWDSLFQRISMYNQVPRCLTLPRIFLKEQIPNRFTKIPILNPQLNRSKIIIEMSGEFQSYKYFATEMESIHKLIDFEGQARRKMLPMYDVGVWDDISLNNMFVLQCLEFLKPSKILYYSSLSHQDLSTQLLQFSQCCNNYIISSSCIAFWSAYLNKCTTKLVFYDAQPQDDFYPPEWKNNTFFKEDHK